LLSRPRSRIRGPASCTTSSVNFVQGGEEMQARPRERANLRRRSRAERLSGSWDFFNRTSAVLS
jgi:hypothetical protein